MRYFIKFLSLGLIIFFIHGCSCNIKNRIKDNIPKQKELSSNSKTLSVSNSICSYDIIPINIIDPGRVVINNSTRSNIYFDLNDSDSLISNNLSEKMSEDYSIKEPEKKYLHIINISNFNNGELCNKKSKQSSYVIQANLNPYCEKEQLESTPLLNASKMIILNSLTSGEPITSEIIRYICQTNILYIKNDFDGKIKIDVETNNSLIYGFTYDINNFNVYEYDNSNSFTRDINQGEHYLRIENPEGATTENKIEYTIKAEFQPDKCSDKLYPMDIALNSQYNNTICQNDIWKVNVSERGTLEVTISNHALEYMISKSKINFSVAEQPLNKGEYYIRVFNNSNHYKLKNMEKKYDINLSFTKYQKKEEPENKIEVETDKKNAPESQPPEIINPEKLETIIDSFYPKNHSNFEDIGPIKKDIELELKIRASDSVIRSFTPELSASLKVIIEGTQINYELFNNKYSAENNGTPEHKVKTKVNNKMYYKYLLNAGTKYFLRMDNNSSEEQTIKCILIYIPDKVSI